MAVGTDVKGMESSATELTRELVSIRSDELCGDRERAVADVLKQRLEQMGCDVRLQEVEEGRANVIGILRGEGGGRALMFNGHMDTVPPGNMVDPFSGEIRDGAIHGRGSADMKSGIACMIAATEAIVGGGPALAGDVQFVWTVGEETGSRGMDAFIRDEEQFADFCVVGEPTGLALGLAHKGIEWLSITTTGKAAHASLPSEGTNAVVHMAHVVRALEEQLVPRLRRLHHALLGSPTLTVGTIRGGVKLNIVPASCTIEVDRRWLPEESVELVVKELQDILDDLEARVPGFRATLTRLPDISEVWHGPLQTAEKSQIARIAKQAIEKETKPRTVGLPFWTDGALAHHAGIPTVILGPGDPEQCHTDDEHVPLDHVKKAARIYRTLCLSICGER